MGMEVPGERTETEEPVGGEYGGFCLGRVGSEVSGPSTGQHAARVMWVQTPQGGQLSYREHQENHKQIGKSMACVWMQLPKEKGTEEETTGNSAFLQSR